MNPPGRLGPDRAAARCLHLDLGAAFHQEEVADRCVDGGADRQHAATLATEMQVLHDELPTLNTLDPLEVPFEREQYELTVEADRYTLATRLRRVHARRGRGRCGH